MQPTIVMPDIELWGTRWIRAMLLTLDRTDVHVDHRVPKPRKSRMVIVRGDGGPRVDMLHQLAFMGVNVWAPSEQEATDLSRLVEAALLGVRASYPVEYVNSSGSTVRVDDESPRRFFSVQVLVRGEEAGTPESPYVYPVPGSGGEDTFPEFGRDPYGNLIINGGGANETTGA